MFNSWDTLENKGHVHSYGKQLLVPGIGGTIKSSQQHLRKREGRAQRLQEGLEDKTRAGTSAGWRQSEPRGWGLAQAAEQLPALFSAFCTSEFLEVSWLRRKLRWRVASQAQQVKGARIVVPPREIRLLFWLPTGVLGVAIRRTRKPLSDIVTSSLKAIVIATELFSPGLCLSSRASVVPVQSVAVLFPYLN